MRSRQTELPFEGPSPVEGVPFLYLACPLTSVDPNERQLLDSWCAHIRNCITETCTGSEDSWELGVHVPFWWSNPASGNTMAPEDVYELNYGKVRDCAGVVVLALRGGSTGVGQELTWAMQLRLPTLYLYPSGQGRVSRQVEGTPGDLTVVGFEDAEQLVDAVASFLRANRAVIQDHTRRAKDEAVKFVALRMSLYARWRQLSPPERQQAAGAARVHAERVDDLLATDRSIAAASVSELAALAGELGVSLRALAPEPTPPDLSSREREALMQVSDEFEWSGSKALHLELRARSELARGGIRRLRLESPADWLRFDKYVQHNARRR